MISTIASALIPATTISTTIDSTWNSTTTIITTALNTSQYLFYTPSAASSIGAQNITTRHSGTSSIGAAESGVIDLQTLDDIFNFNLNNNGTSIPPGASITGGTNSTNSGYYPVFPTYIRNTSMVFCVIIMCLGVIGNVMVPIVILKTKDMRNSTNIFLVNLSVADLLVLLVCTPTVLVEVNSRPETWVLGEEMCKAVPFVELTVAHASVLTILAISFERYYAICEPLKAGYVCTKTRASLICLLAWFFAAVFTSPILCIADYRYVEYFDGSTVPACQTLANSFWPAFYFLMTIFVFFIIPLIILLVLYLIIAKTLIHDAKHIVCNKHPDQYSIRGRKQVVLMLGTVIFIFFVCLIPFRVFILWIIVSPDETVFKLGVEKYYNILYFCRVMVYLNSAINPILYNLMSSKFRHGFMLVCLRQKNSIHFRSRDRSGTLRTSLTSYRNSMIRQNSSLKINNFRMNSLDSSPKFHNRLDQQELRSRLCSTANDNNSPLFYRNGRNNSTETQISFRNLRLIDEEQQYFSDEPLNSTSALATPILTFTQYRLEEYIDGTMVPVCWTSAESFWTAFFFVTIILLFFFIPLAILMILYTIIARTLMEHPSILLHTSKNNNVPSHTTLIYRKQVVLMLGTVVLAFFICLLPFRAFTLWIIIVPPEKLVSLGIEGYYYLLFFCRIMFHINSAINPILYNLMSSKFRDGFLKLCGMKKRKIKRFIIRRSDHSKLDRKNTCTNTSISNSTTHTHCTDSFWRRYSSRNASEKSFRGATTTTTTTTVNSGTPIRKNLDTTNCSSLSVSHGGSPIVGFSGIVNDNNTELRRASSFVRKSNSLLGKRFGVKMEESYV